MGKNARQKKELRESALVQEKRQIERRRLESQAPMKLFIRRFILTVMMTLVLFYIGQVVYQKIVAAEAKTEAIK